MKTVALLAALLATGTAQAAMLCARPRADGTFSATVKIREACRPNEVELGIITLDPLRLSGPPTTSTSVTSTSTTSSSITTTTLPSCGSSGRLVGGVCWYMAGDEADDCNQTCAGVGRTYNEATRTFAGSDGTLANCNDVARAFWPIGPGAVDLSGCTTGRGCAMYFDPDSGFYPSRCVTPATTAAAGGDLNLRLCACS
jgi:hypothetical protein